jgi:hypothetical protein
VPAVASSCKSVPVQSYYDSYKCPHVTHFLFQASNLGPENKFLKVQLQLPVSQTVKCPQSLGNFNGPAVSILGLFGRAFYKTSPSYFIGSY